MALAARKPSTDEAARIRPAREGETFYTGPAAGQPRERWSIGPKCSTNRGHWICITHPDDELMRSYPTQMQKDAHIHGDGQHVLAWVCEEHGAEVP